MNPAREFSRLVQEFREAIIAMTDEEIAATEEFNRVCRENAQNREATQARRLDLLLVLTAIKKQKIPIEKQLLQRQLDKLNSF